MPSSTAKMTRAVAPTRCRKTMVSVTGSRPPPLADAAAEVVDGGGQSLLERYRGLPAEVARGAGVVQRDAIHVALAPGTVLRLELVAGQQRELAEELVDGHRVAAADVICADGAVLERGKVGGRDVADVQHVARLLAIAVDGQRAAFDHPAREDRYHATFFALEILTRAVDVRVAQDREVEPERAVEGAEVLLETEFARAVWRERAD